MRRQHQDDPTRIFYELSSLVLTLLHSPPTPNSFSDHPPSPWRTTRSEATATQMTPAGFASLMLGMSVALMLCGTVAFFIGCLLMPWVVGLVMVFYVAGIVSAISMLGRSLLCYATSPPKEIPAWKVL